MRIFVLLSVIVLSVLGGSDGGWKQLPSYNTPPIASEQGGLAVFKKTVIYYDGVRSCEGNGTACSGQDTCVNIFLAGLHSYGIDTGLWSYNIDVASTLKPSNRSTFGYTSHQDNKWFLLYGGVTYQGGSTTSCDTSFKDGLWAWKTVEAQWVRLDVPTDVHTPGSRVDSSIFVRNGDIYLFAGLKSPGILKNDILRFNLANMTWSVVSAGGSNTTQFPRARYHQRGIYDEETDRFIVAWGDNFLFKTTLVHINDIWAYSFVTNTWALIESGSKKALYHPVAGLYNGQFLLGGGDLRPRPFEVEFDTFALNITSITICNGNTTCPPNVTYSTNTTLTSFDIDADVDAEYFDPTTGFESDPSDIHYIFDTTDDGAPRRLMRIYPKTTPGEFKMSAFGPYKDKNIVMRGGFNYWCAKFADNCPKKDLDDVYILDMSDL